MDPVEAPPAIVDWTKRLEDATVLDAPVQAIEPYIQKAFGTGARASALRGDWLGHAVHPILTDLVMGSWTSATVLDLLGGEELAEALRHASPSTPDDVTTLPDGRLIDSRESAMGWLTELAAAHAGSDAGTQ